MKPTLTRVVTLLEALKVFASDYVHLESDEDCLYWEGVRDGIAMALTPLKHLVEYFESGGGDEV